MRGDKAASLALAALLIGSIYAIVTPVQSVNADSVEVASIPGHYIIRMDLTPDESQIYVVTRTVSNTVIGSLFRITTSTGVVEELLSSMTTPRNVFFNQVDGNVYFCYGSNQEFHRFNPSTNAVTFFADAENCDSGYVDSDGSIVFATHTGAPPFVNGGGVERLSLAGTISTVVSPFAFVVRDVAEDSNGNLYLTSEDTAANREIRRVAPDATQTVMMTGSSIGDQIEIIDDRLFTNSPGAVTEWDLDGNFVGTIYQGAPDAIKAKSLWVGDDALHKIFKINLPTCTPPPSGLVSWWPGDGNAMDIQGENHGTLQNGATFAAGKVGQALSFDGADDFVDIPDSANLNPTGTFTIDGWFYIDPDAAGNAGELSTLASKSDGGSDSGGWFLLYDDGQLGATGFSNALRFTVFGGDAIIAEAAAQNIITASGWYFVVGVFDAAGTPQAKLYVNGNLVASSTSTIPSILSNSLSMRIGAMHNNERFGLIFGNDRLNGLADEVEFFNRALSQSEIQAIYDAGSAGKCKDLEEPPTADPNGPYEGTEGSAVILDGSGSTDTDGTIISYDWDLDSDAAFDDATGATPAVTFADNGLYNIGLMVTDDDGLTGTATTQVTITNANPVVGAITAPIDPVQVNTAVSSSAPFTDAGTLDTHTAEWSWGDGTTSAGTVTESDGSGTIAGSHSYTTPGVYTVQLTVTDDDGGIGMQTYNYVVIYDPTAGFVTGGGWIDSPAGAYTADTSLTGKAIFGFTSKYEKGATTPTGKTNFKFHVASLDFNSNNYDWLVVAGAKAQYKGTGTINGAGDYGFMLTAIDGQITGGGGTDKFRIKIWDKATDLVVYDNQLGALDDASPTTAIGGGNIKIHKS